MFACVSFPPSQVPKFSQCNKGTFPSSKIACKNDLLSLPSPRSLNPPEIHSICISTIINIASHSNQVPIIAPITTCEPFSLCHWLACQWIPTRFYSWCCHFVGELLSKLMRQHHIKGIVWTKRTSQIKGSVHNIWFECIKDLLCSSITNLIICWIFENEPTDQGEWSANWNWFARQYFEIKGRDDMEDLCQVKTEETNALDVRVIRAPQIAFTPTYPIWLSVIMKNEMRLLNMFTLILIDTQSKRMEIKT